MIVMTRCEKREPRSCKCDRDRLIGAAIVLTKGADEYAVAELKNDEMCNGFTEVLVRCDNESSILALKEYTATTLKLAGVTIKAEKCVFVRLTKQRAGRERCEGCETCRKNLACLVKRFGQEFTVNIQSCRGL